MKGWIRLWVFLSLVWIAFVAWNSFFDYVPVRSTDERAVLSRLSARSADYFREWTPEDRDISHTQWFQYSDGSRQGISFPILTEENIETIPDKLKETAAREGKAIEEAEITRFVELVREQNDAAISASQEFERLVVEATDREFKRHRDFIWGSIFLLLSFPLGSLVLGLGVIWVIRGFKSQQRVQS